MDYISTTIAAEKWGVSPRQVQRLLAESRISGARKYGRLWMVPADLEKPGDPRKGEPHKQLYADLCQIITATTMPMPRANPDAVLDTISEERLCLQYQGELAYLRGDFETTKKCYEKTAGDNAARLRASSIAIAAAISLGDYSFYLEIESFLKGVIENSEKNELKVIAELFLSTAYVSAGILNLVPSWLKDGNFAALIAAAKPDAAYKRVKYFQFLGQPESMLATAQTAWQLCALKSKISFHDIYFQIACAMACYALGRINEATRWLLDAMNIALPHGFITPFAESATTFGSLLDKCLKQEYPEYCDAMAKLWKRSFPNWMIFHNLLTKDNITVILSQRDYQIAQFAAHGIPYKVIAEQFHISVGTLKNRMQVIYDMLHISEKPRRQELAKFVF